MSNVQSYNALIDRFKAFASGHFILKSFSHGQIDTADLEKFTEYPFMHVVPSNVTYAKGTKTFSFQIVLADLPRDKDDKVEFQREVLSDLQRIAEDLVAEITNHRVLFGDLITVQNVTLEPFLEEFHNTLTGWTVSLELLVPYYWDACSIPAEWNDMFESGSGGTGSILTFIDSITRDQYGNVSLVNDEATPAPNYYYGTNDEGVRGWYLLTDEVGLTCATIGTCQTIIDIEAEIDLLQQDVTDLQADVVAIETELPNKVPYTGATQDVNLGEFGVQLGNLEFDITPTNIPTAQGSVYWDDNAETLALIMNGTTQKVGEDTFYHVRNTTGSTIPKGTAVRFAGTTGNSGRLLIAPMIANGTTPSQYYMGVTSEEILNNADGKVYQFGKMRGVNTSSFADGDILYVSTTVAGGFQTTPPTAPNNIIVAAAVVHSANNGTLMIRPTLGSNINADEGVLITTPTDNQALVYESASSLWKNETIDKTFVGLGNVDNTSDANKPVSTATQTALNAKQDTLVSGTNIKTINGNSVLGSGDLVVGGSTSLAVGTTPITSGTVGRVLFQGTGNVLQQSANFFWDNTNGRLGIGGTPSAFTLDVNGTSRVQGDVQFGLSGALDTNFSFSCGTRYGGQGKFSIIGQGATGSYIGIGSGAGATTGDNFVFAKAYLNEFGNNVYGFVGLSNTTPMTFRFGALGSSVEALRLTNTSVILRATTGNVLIGTTTDAGFKLDVNGTGRISGALSAAGGNATGTGSVSIGTLSSAGGSFYAAAIGYQSTASNSHAIAIGYQATASANSSYAFGKAANASASNSTAFSNAYARADNSVAWGNNSRANGISSMAGGAGAYSYLTGQLAISGGAITYYGDSQYSIFTSKLSTNAVNSGGTYSFTGVRPSNETFISGVSQMWYLDCTVMISIKGKNSTVTEFALDDIYTIKYKLAIKSNKNTGTQILGTPVADSSFSNTSMSSTIVSFAIVSNDLVVSVTPPTWSSAGQVIFRGTASFCVTELGTYPQTF